MPSAASGSIGVGVDVGVDVDVGEMLLVGVPVGGTELVVADAEEDGLLDGECVGFGVFRAVVVGLGGRVALGVSGAVLRLVPVE